MSQKELIKKIRKAIEEDPSRDYIKSVSLFGSHLHGDAKEDSDVDLLFEPGKSMGYFKLFGIQKRISDKVGREIELLTKQELSKYFRNEVIKEAKRIY